MYQNRGAYSKKGNVVKMKIGEIRQLGRYRKYRDIDLQGNIQSEDYQKVRTMVSYYSKQSHQKYDDFYTIIAGLCKSKLGSCHKWEYDRQLIYNQ